MRFTWGEFIELGYLREFRDAQVSLQTLRPFIMMLREEFGIPYPLAHKDTFLGGHRDVVLRIQRGAALDESPYMVIADRNRGQLVIPSAEPPLSEPVHQFLRRVEFDDHVARRWLPIGEQSCVVVDPEQTFGIPTIRGIRTEILADAFDAGESIEEGWSVSAYGSRCRGGGTTSGWRSDHIPWCCRRSHGVEPQHPVVSGHNYHMWCCRR